VTLLSVSVVIPTRRRPVDLDRCLERIARQTTAPLETIVVDNSEGDTETQDVTNRWSARYVIEPIPGLSRARNRGAIAASGDIIAYLDDDSLPEPQWLAGFESAFREHPSVAGAAGRTLPTSVDTEAERLFAELRGGAYDRPDFLIVDSSHPDWFQIAGFGGIGPGCNMAFRRTAFEKWSGFNERTGRGTPLQGADEQHAFLSLVKLGFAVAYVPDAIVRHPVPSTIADLQRRYLQDAASSTSYFTMLLAEGSGLRMQTLTYLIESALGRRRNWRNQKEVKPTVVPRIEKLGASFRGPINYLRARFERRPPALDLTQTR
jgi:glycosyltransferase involved in cell wall biosynthesis